MPSWGFSYLSVYTVNALCILKSGAYFNRDKIRDLFDLSFIVNNYFDQLSPDTKFMVQNALATKGLDQFEYLINSQEDVLVDKDALEISFLKMHEKLGLLAAPSDYDLETRI